MDFHAITSQEVLERISRHCPGSLSTYLQVLNRMGKTAEVHISRREIEYDMSETWTKFRNNLKKLALENLLEWHPIDGGVTVIMADQYDDE